MKRRPKPPAPEEDPAADANAILQVKFWLTGISPMVWRRVLVPANCTLRELHGVIQVAMGWEGIHLYDFHLHAARYGSWEVAASSPDVTLAALRFRKGRRAWQILSGCQSWCQHPISMRFQAFVPCPLANPWYAVNRMG